MKTIQALFDKMIENQAWYGLSFQAKVETLAVHFGGTVAITAAPVIAVRRAYRTKQETALPRRTRYTAPKSGRYAGPTLFNLDAAPAAASYAVSLLRALGRKAVNVQTALGEVYQMVKEEAGLDPAFSFVSVAARAAWNALVRAVSV